MAKRPGAKKVACAYQDKHMGNEVVQRQAKPRTLKANTLMLPTTSIEDLEHASPSSNICHKHWHCIGGPPDRCKDVENQDGRPAETRMPRGVNQSNEKLAK